MKGEFKTGFWVGLGVVTAVTVAGLLLNWLVPNLRSQTGY